MKNLYKSVFRYGPRLSLNKGKEGGERKSDKISHLLALSAARGASYLVLKVLIVCDSILGVVDFSLLRLLHRNRVVEPCSGVSFQVLSVRVRSEYERGLHEEANRFARKAVNSVGRIQH